MFEKPMAYNNNQALKLEEEDDRGLSSTFNREQSTRTKRQK